MKRSILLTVRNTLFIAFILAVVGSTIFLLQDIQPPTQHVSEIITKDLNAL